MTRESLPDDGASYQCCFDFTEPGFEPWRCPRPATEAVTQEFYNNFEHKTIFLHGRAMCEAHLLILNQ